MSIQTSDLDDVQGGEKLLDSNLYGFKITRAEILNKERDGETRQSLFVIAEVVDGPTQVDKSEPEGDTVSLFFPLNGYETMKDGGTYVKSRLKSFLVAVLGELDGDDVDENDLIGEEFRGRVVVGKDLDGDPVNEIRKFMPSA